MSAGATDVLAAMLAAPAEVPAITSLDDWWRRYLAVCERYPGSVDRALAGGFEADRLGYAFASGYQAACRAAFPTLADGQPRALCATESGGVHPRAIATAWW
jgi:hypothetical protein